MQHVAAETTLLCVRARGDASGSARRFNPTFDSWDYHVDVVNLLRYNAPVLMVREGRARLRVAGRALI